VPPQRSGVTAPDPGSTRRRDEAVVVTDEEGAKAAESTMPGKEPGGRVAHDDDPERDLAWAVDDSYVVVIVGRD
jgi:hypothetical protein